jgi:hypothetical protein
MSVDEETLSQEDFALKQKARVAFSWYRRFSGWLLIANAFSF